MGKYSNKTIAHNSKCKDKGSPGSYENVTQPWAKDHLLTGNIKRKRYTRILTDKEHIQSNKYACPHSRFLFGYPEFLLLFLFFNWNYLPKSLCTEQTLSKEGGGRNSHC